ncbi:MAG: hypothetical protein KME05_22680 [Gloeocapsa sp. UFS-A4-WI-NPMV-4B04]|nr:hypothetical protein [Gloeocapsa sp. UFS-A4-WI-NPMV-4B04]
MLLLIYRWKRSPNFEIARITNNGRSRQHLQTFTTEFWGGIENIVEFSSFLSPANSSKLSY